MADTDLVKEGTLTAENTFTAWLEADQIRTSHQGSARDFADISVNGTWEGTLTIQRRFKNSIATVRDVDTVIHTAGNDSDGFEDEVRARNDVEVRIGFKTGDFTSGTANVRMGLGVAV